MRESAVMADVAAQLGERYKDLARIGDVGAVSCVAPGGCGRGQGFEGAGRETLRFFMRNSTAIIEGVEEVSTDHNAFLCLGFRR
jgi:hypothetical protein